MWRDALRDLQWRRRRFVIAIAGTSLVFAMTLLLAGVAQSFRAETSRTLDALGIDSWVVRTDSTRSFASFIPESTAEVVGRLPGVSRSGALIYFPQTIATTRVIDVNVFGHHIGGIGAPPVSRGRAVAAPLEAVADESLDVDIGSSLRLGPLTLKVVGLSSGLTLFAGQPNVYVSIIDLQKSAFSGARLATAVGIRGRPAGLPPGLEAVPLETIKANYLRPLKNAIGALDAIKFLLWIVAACIIGAVIYLSALERGRDFAVFKATGMSSYLLLGGLVIQSTILSIGAAALSAALANVLAPTFPLHVTIPLSSYAILVGVALVIGFLASSFAVRRASAVDPALAFGGP